MPTDAPTTRDRDAETRQDAAARRLRWAYITGLCIIAGLATTKAIVSSAILERARHDAAVINIAGRQRMLSQQIAKAALHYEHAATIAEVHLAHDELQFAVNEWAGSHRDLRFGSDERGIPEPKEPEIVEAYAEVQAPFDRVRDAAAALLIWEETHGLADHRAPEVLRSIDTILEYESVFLPKMHAIVGMHEAAAREHVAGLVRAKNMLLAVTLVALLLEIIILFEPAVRTMSRRLREANAERRRAEALARHKTDFLANMSHEIRTPMTAILGYADLLLEPEITPTQRSEHIQTIRTNGEHLLALINDILDMSKIEAGMLDVERVACHPAQIIEDTLSLMRNKAHQKGLTIEASADGPVPKTIAADPLRIRQILVNLVGNAIKFTSSGSVRVVTSVTQQADQHWLDIAVTDTGIGIAPDMLARIFEAFGQAESNTARRFGGTGLGLSISSHLAQAMGGRISVASVHGKGSTFTLHIPAGINPSLVATPSLDPDPTRYTDADPAADSPLRGLHILLAEDGIDNQRLIAFHLKKAGARVTVVDEGNSAVEVASDTAAEIDLVLMDVQMPGMDGLVATSTLRRLGVTLPILALTANALAQDRERCITVGCDDHLTKPIDAAKLVASCLRWSRRKPRENRQRPPSAA